MNPSPWRTLIALTIALPLLVACGGGDVAPAPDAASDLSFDEELLDAYVAQRMPQGPAPTPEQRELLADELRNFLALATAAEVSGLGERQDVINLIRLDRARALASNYLRDAIDQAAIDEAALRARYAEQSGEGGMELKARHILVEDEAAAVALIAELDGGADFQELARTHSTGPSGPRGGDLGWFLPSDMVPPFAEATQALADGSYTGAPVQTQFGWHVILREGSREVPVAPYESMEAQLRQAAEREVVERAIEEARAAYDAG